MASCSPFDIEFSISPQDLLEKVTALVDQNGGTISGDSDRGRFTLKIPMFGKVEGTFTTSEQVCMIHITQRPFLLQCSIIESFIRDNLSDVENETVTGF